MRLPTTISLLLLALTTAINAASTAESIADQLPACAKTCLAEVASSVGCEAADYECQCNKVPDLDGAAADCFAEGCDSGEIGMVTVIAASICEAVRRTNVATRTAPLQPAGATTTPPSGNDKHDTEAGAGAATTGTTGQDATSENGAAVGVTSLGWVGGVAVLAAMVL